ncbi:MAG: NigD-like N-terminal domain-containing protein [Prevotellaceae bacterium]|jgi:hypothetical protein|nr:NigD-like N-terminal domain-containing protein [Prevotellaceae bacterium]
MKRLFLIGIIACLYSCGLEETGDYSESFGVVKISGNETLYIESDDGEVLIPKESISTFADAGDRVWVSYSIENKNNNRDTLTVSLYRASRIMTIDSQTESTLNDDGIDLWAVWITQGFLTFDFRIRADNPDKIKGHEYALVIPKQDITDTVFLDFRHDAKGDNNGVLCRTAVALKLENLYIPSDSIIIALNYKNLNGTKQTEYRMYKAKDLNGTKQTEYREYKVVN